MAISLLASWWRVRAQDGGLTETFDDPARLGWDHFPGVQVIDGVLRIEPGNIVARHGDWGDFELAARLRWFGEGEIMITYRLSDAGGYHLVLGRDFIISQREVDEVITELAANSPIMIPPEEWFQIEILLVGGEQQILINGELLLESFDEGALFSGGIAFEALGEAVLEVDELTLMSGREKPPPETEATPGPTQIGEITDSGELTWVRIGGPPGGLGYDIRMDPRNPDVLYVTDALAGVFKSTNGGANWFPINNGITARVGPSGDGIPIFSLTIDPNNPDTIWVGTQFGGGVFRSDDGGESWQSMSNGIQERSLTIRGFTVEPGNSDVVYLGGEVSSWEWSGSPLDGLGFDLTKGVVYKSTDGGENWSRIWFGNNLARYIWVHPEDHNLLYVSTGIFDREAANSNLETFDPGGVGILRSTNGGLTWEELGINRGIRPEELYFGSLAMHPTNPKILLGAAASDAHQWALDYPTGAVYRTEDGGDSWERVLDLPNASAVEICENDPNVVYAGSASVFHRSDDGGFTWQQTGEGFWGPSDMVAGIPIDMQCDPRDPMRLFVNNYGGGNFLSEDGGQTWVNASKGYTGALMSQVTVMPGNPAQVFASARSGIFKSTDGGETWAGMSHGIARSMEAFAIAVNPQDPAHLIATIGDAGPIPKISYDGGQTWQEAEPDLGEMDLLTWGTMKKIFFSPVLPERVIGIQGEEECGGINPCEEGRGVLFSTDGGMTWNLSGLRGGIGTDLVFALDGSAYVSIYPGDIYRSTDHGENWELAAQKINADIHVADPDPDTPGPALISLSIDPQNLAKLYAGFTRGGVMVSEDGGATWRASSSGMVPESSIFDLITDAAHPGVIYAASNDTGVYRSTDSGETWVAINDGLLTRAGVSLALSADGSVLYLATTGGGVFRLGIPSSIPPQTQPESVSSPEGTTELPDEPTSTQPEPNSDPTGKPSPIQFCLGGLALLVFAGLVLVWWRRR